MIIVLLLFVGLCLMVGGAWGVNPNPPTKSDSDSNSRSLTPLSPFSSSESQSPSVSHHSVSHSNSISHKSDSKSKSESKSHSTSHQSNSHSASHNSESQSESQPWLPNVGIICSPFLVFPLSEELVFLASELPPHETCKGENFLHYGNSKNWITHDGLNRHWQERRKCKCAEFRVCANYTECSHKEKNFTVTVTLPGTVNTGGPVTCVVNPYRYFPIPPNLLAQGGIPPTPYPTVNCTFQNPGHFNFTGNMSIYVAPSIPANVTATCRVISISFGESAAEVYVVLQCLTNEFYGCVDPIPMVTRLEQDIARDACTHHKFTGTPNDGAGKITGFSVAGVVGIVLVALLIWWFVLWARSDSRNYKRMRDTELASVNSRYQ